MSEEDYTSVYMQGYYAGKDKAFEQNEQERQEYRKLLDKHKKLQNNWNKLKEHFEFLRLNTTGGNKEFMEDIIELMEALESRK